MEPLHPPYSIEPPRQLNRWLDVNSQNGSLTRTEKFVVLPTFTIAAPDWAGYSQIVGVFNYISPNNFSLRTDYIRPTNPNYLLCVMWVDNMGNVFRYKLWDNVGEALFFVVPLYTGQLIKHNFRFEVWTTGLTPNQYTVIPPIAETGGDGGAVPPVDGGSGGGGGGGGDICTPTDYDTVTPDVLSANVSWFQSAASFPAGNYRLSYTTGAMQYNFQFGYSIQWPRGQNGFRLVYNNGIDIFNAPGDAKFYPTPEACEAANAGAFIEFEHTGGKIGVMLDDQAAYDDNLGAVSYQLHRVCYDVMPPAPPAACVFADTDWSWDLGSTIPVTGADETVLPYKNSVVIAQSVESFGQVFGTVQGTMALPLNTLLNGNLLIDVSQLIFGTFGSFSGDIKVETSAGDVLLALTEADFGTVGTVSTNFIVPSYSVVRDLFVTYIGRVEPNDTKIALTIIVGCS